MRAPSSAALCGPVMFPGGPDFAPSPIIFTSPCRGNSFLVTVTKFADLFVFSALVAPPQLVGVPRVKKVKKVKKGDAEAAEKPAKAAKAVKAKK